MPFYSVVINFSTRLEYFFTVLDSVGQAENLMALTNIGVGEVQHMTGGGGGSTQTSRGSVLRSNSEQFSTTPKSLQPEKSPQCKTPTR